MERRIKYGNTLLCILIAILIIYGYFSHMSTRPPVHGSPSLRLSAFELINTAAHNESLFANKYLGKIISVEGSVLEIKKNPQGNYSILLNATPADTSSIGPNHALPPAPTSLTIVCTMDSAYNLRTINLQPGDNCSIRGACAGLLHDIIMSQCIIEP